jgi:flavin reductase (DIM6/NTAB) family NADH-FMN oxidoreductase RutF
MPSTALPPQAAAPDFSSSQFRQALGQFATGVTVVTARSADGELAGLTVSSFNAVSLQPPLVLWSLNKTSGAMSLLNKASHYAIHVLAADQQALAERFAGPREQRWVGQPWQQASCGAPLLPGCLAVFECFSRSQYNEGDHVIFVGEVERCQSRSASSPLLYHGGRFHAEHAF